MKTEKKRPEQEKPFIGQKRFSCLQNHSSIHKSYMYVWNGRFLFARYGLDNELHKHHLAAVVIAVDSPFYVTTETVRNKYDAALIPPDTLHRTEAKNDPIIVLLIDPERPEYEKFTSKGATDSVIELDYSRFEHLKKSFRAIFQGSSG